MSEPTYRIEEDATSGWTVFDEKSSKLTKAQAQQRLNELMSEGVNPNTLRLVRDD